VETAAVVPGAVVETAAVVPEPEEPMILTYWGLFAKGVAPAVALVVGGFPWALGAAPGSQGTGDLWGEWLEMKPNTVWGFLPNLDIGGGEKVGSELAILQYLARRAPALEGFNDFDIRVSQELLHQAEELYQKLTSKCPTILAPDKSPEDFDALWNGADRNTHSSQQGVPVYLAQFEEFYARVGGNSGKFTSSGTTIGEIKLYATLAILLLIDNTVLANFPGVLEFYMRWDNDPQIKELLDTAMAEWNWATYFIKPAAPEEVAQVPDAQ